MAEQDFNAVLQRHIAEGRSGTLMAIFTDNSLARAYILDGVPVSARYKTLEGDEALQAALPMSVASLRFHDNTDLVRSQKLLGGTQNPAATTPPTPPPPAAATPPSAPPPAPAPATPPPITAASPTAVLTDIGRTRLGELLAEYIGPVAPLVMSDLPANVSVDAAISAVAQEIDSTEQAAAFIATARAML